MAGDSAPGLGRVYYGFTKWRGHLEPVWQELVEEALEREQQGLNRDWPTLTGYDADHEMIGFARENIRRAGLADKIQVSRKELLTLREGEGSGWLICNPPYGERLDEQGAVRYLYRGLGNRLQECFRDWKVGLFTSQTEYADLLMIPWQQSYRLYNGPLACRLYAGQVEKRAVVPTWEMQPRGLEGSGSDFSNRLRKNFKQLQRWLQKGAITSFRLYDRDLQEYNVTVELYDKYVFVREHPSSSRIDEVVANKRFSSVLHGLRALLGVSRDRVFASRSRSAKQGRKPKQKLHEIREGRGSYLLDFSASTNVGLNLLHRGVRQRIQEEAAGKQVLNLYGQTGSLSVAAAHGDAAGTTTVEPHPFYVAWTRKNFYLNGMHEDKHQLVHADCLEWLRKQTKQYDLVFADLSGMKPASSGGGFDPARLSEIISTVMAVLHPVGTFYFTSDHSPQASGGELGENYDCSDITNQVVPRDFANGRGRFHCWSFRHRAESLPNER